MFRKDIYIYHSCTQATYIGPTIVQLFNSKYLDISTTSFKCRLNTMLLITAITYKLYKPIDHSLDRSNRTSLQRHEITLR